MTKLSTSHSPFLMNVIPRTISMVLFSGSQPQRTVWLWPFWAEACWRVSEWCVRRKAPGREAASGTLPSRQDWLLSIGNLRQLNHTNRCHVSTSLNNCADGHTKKTSCKCTYISTKANMDHNTRPLNFKKEKGVDFYLLYSMVFIEIVELKSKLVFY